MNYHIARDGQQLGVFSDLDVSSRLRAGELRTTDLCWTEGMSEWRPLGSVPAFSTVQMAPPPPASMPTYGAPPQDIFQRTANPYAAPVSVLPTVVQDGAVLATLGQRLGAATLDGIMSLVFAAPLIFGIFSTIEAVDRDGGGPDFPPLSMALFAIGGLGLLGLMIYNLVRLTTHGQTLGKKWVNIRIVAIEDHSNPGFVKAVLLRGIVNMLISLVVPFYGLVDVCFIFADDRRCLHDKIAGTRVIQGTLS